MTISNVFIFLVYVLSITVYADDLDFISDEIDSSEFGQTAGKVATNCSCGWTNKSNKRIFGGVETNPHEYPLMAALMNYNESLYYCGATIISAYHGLTAAHCTIKLKNITLSIYIGTHDFSDEKEKLFLEDIKETIEHEKYDKIEITYDISLLVLENKIKFTNIIGPACLPKHKIDLTEKYVKILGWGRTAAEEKTSSKLLKINSKIIPLSNCAKHFSIKSTDPHQICTYGHNKDACKGDSGGPILWLDPETNRYTQVGIVSLGEPNCGEKVGAVQTDISYFMDWITTKMAETEPNGKICTKV